MPPNLYVHPSLAVTETTSEYILSTSQGKVTISKPTLQIPTNREFNLRTVLNLFKFQQFSLFI